MVKKLLSSLGFVFMQSSLASAQVVERFPKPDFRSDYSRPILQLPAPRSEWLGYLDVLVLFAALALASYFALKLRSRTKVFLLMVFSLAYFGFFRKGCICPVGSIQNVSFGLFDSGYVLPLTGIIFFCPATGVYPSFSGGLSAPRSAPWARFRMRSFSDRSR